MLKKFIILLPLLTILLGWKCDNGEILMPTAEIRPNGPSIYEPSTDFFYREPSIADPYHTFVNNEPDDDTSYIYSVGLFLDNPISMALSMEDLPADLIESTELRVRIRWFYDTISMSRPLTYTWKLKSRVGSWEWSFSDDIAPFDLPIHYDEFVLPDTLNLAALNDMEWYWSIDDAQNSWYRRYIFGVTEVRVEVDYTAAEMVHELCSPGTFQTQIAVRGTIPECN